MYNYYPLIFVGAVIGIISAVFIIAYAVIKDKKTEFGFERNMKDSEIIKRLLSYARPHAGSFALAGLFMLISIGYDIASPLLIGRIEELIKDDFEMPALITFVMVYAGILIVSLISTYVQAIILQKAGQKIVSSIREDVFSKVESLSHSQLHKIPVGKLVTRVVNDTNSVSRLFTNILVTLVKNILVIFGVLVGMLCVNFMLTLMVLCFVPFIVLFTMIFRKFSRRAYRKTKDATTDINTYLSENLSGMKITQIFNREDKKRQEFSLKNGILESAKKNEIFVFAIFRPLVYMLYICSVLCLLYIGGMGYINNVSFLGQSLSAGIIVSFYMYISKFFNPIQSLAEQFNWLQSAFASGEKIFTILDIEPDVVDDESAAELKNVDGDIEFCNVWFAYEGENWILRDVSFKINAKETVAFVGATGSGKTTILSLLCRNYDIQKGKILVDGMDIRTVKISSLRRHFGQMLQDVFLFSGTIRSNIVLRDENISDEEVMEACRYVNADSFINKLPGGIYEEVRERGNNFSAGQRQLLSFARTVIHKPAVMILDEATANIDTETELLIQNSLEKMMNIGTMLIVAHRLSTVAHADKIILLSHGEIIEEGTHKDLIASKGRYYELYTLQEKKQSSF